MNEIHSITVTSPSPSVIRRREELCDEFEENLKAGTRPNPQAYLDRVDEQHRSTLLFELNALLQAYHPEIDQTANPPAANNLESTLPARSTEPDDAKLPAQIGKYKILGRLGEGAMGIVYRAHHPVLNKDIALKTIRPRNVRNHSETERILLEARSVARLKHDHVIAIHDADEADGQPYFTMALVEGGTLQSHLTDFYFGAKQTVETDRQTALTTAGWSRAQIATRRSKILTLMEKVCRAVHVAHAHNPTIIHRDIKPGNILLDGGEPRVSDFGLALSASPDEEDRITEAGTPVYMSPEQYRGEAKNILATSDIWALGVVLYELVTGRRPFWGATRREIRLAVLKAEPTPPRQWNPQIDPDLEAVILKCLQNDPAQRYQSAAALADDLARCRDGVPIPIRAIGTTERLRRWAIRKPAQAVLCGLIMLTAVAATALIVQDRRHTSQVARMKQIKVANEAFDKGETLCRQGEAAQGIIWLARSFELAPTDDREQRNRARTAIANWLLQINPLLEMFDEQSPVLSVAFSPNGKNFATGSANGAVRVRDTTTHQVNWSTVQNEHQVLALTFSPDSKKVLTGSLDGIARLWDLSNAGLEPQLKLKHEAMIFAVAFSHDGKKIFTGGGDGIVKEWDSESGQLRNAFPGHKTQIQSLAISTDDQTLLVAAVEAKIKPAPAPGNITRWDLAKGQRVDRPITFNEAVLAVAISPDSRFFATVSNNSAYLWGMASHSAPYVTVNHNSIIRCIAISNKGGTILTGGQDQLVKLWDAESGTPIRAPLYHGDIVRSVAIDPPDTLILSGCRDGIARIWRLSPPTNVPTHHLKLWAQKLTGIAIDDSENVRPLSLQEWQQLRVRMNELGIDNPQ